MQNFLRYSLETKRDTHTHGQTHGPHFNISRLGAAGDNKHYCVSYTNSVVTFTFGTIIMELLLTIVHAHYILLLGMSCQVRHLYVQFYAIILHKYRY
jgi:hypothetical protein